MGTNQITFWRLLLHAPLWASRQLCQADFLMEREGNDGKHKNSEISGNSLGGTVERLQHGSGQWGYLWKNRQRYTGTSVGHGVGMRLHGDF